MGIFRALASAFRAAASKFANKARNVAHRASKRQKDITTQNVRKSAEKKIRQYGERRAKQIQTLSEMDFSRETMEKLFFQRTERIWRGLDPTKRYRAIFDALGVDSLDEAYEIVFRDLFYTLSDEDKPNAWDAMTDEEQYRYAMSIVVRR